MEEGELENRKLETPVVLSSAKTLSDRSAIHMKILYYD